MVSYLLPQSLWLTLQDGAVRCVSRPSHATVKLGLPLTNGQKRDSWSREAWVPSGARASRPHGGTAGKT